MDSIGVSRRQMLGVATATLATIAGCQSADSDDPSSEPTATPETEPPPNVSPETESPVDTPDEYLLDLVPGQNQELRQQIPEEQLNQYKEEFGTELITESNVFSESPGEEWRQMDVDLLALEWWHDNDYQTMDPEEASQFVESIGTNSPEESIEYQAKNRPTGVRYPNSEGKSNTYGHFDYQEFSNSESVGEALDWVQKYLFNWQLPYDDPGPISSEDKLYAAILQESLDRHTELESHFWSFDLPERARSTHGNGLIYDETNNELRVMETIGGPETQTNGSTDEQYHPRVEDSNYLNEGHRAYNSWWHPLRFAEDHQQDTIENHHESLDFQERKEFVGKILMGIPTGGDPDVESGSLTDVGITTEYLVDFADKLRDWNTNQEYDKELFEDIKSQSKVYNKLASREDENYVIYGTVDDPQYAKVDSRGTVNRVWEDQSGEFNEFEQHLEPANA